MNKSILLKIIFFIISPLFLSHNKEITMPQQNPLFTFKRVTEVDIPLLASWFKEPHVKEWWPTPAENEDFFNQFLIKIRSKDTFPYLAFMNGIPIGYIQYYYIDRRLEKAGSWLPELPTTTVGTDQFIGNPQYIGKGYGTQLIKAFISYLTSVLEPSITTIIVDPEPKNIAAIRCYEKVGFYTVGTYETPYGPALLMRYDI